jgi:hypothetical protein
MTMSLKELPFAIITGPVVSSGTTCYRRYGGREGEGERDVRRKGREMWWGEG